MSDVGGAGRGLGSVGGFMPCGLAPIHSLWCAMGYHNGMGKQSPSRTLCRLYDS
jgi:hypothetical protein